MGRMEICYISIIQRVYFYTLVIIILIQVSDFAKKHITIFALFILAYELLVTEILYELPEIHEFPIINGEPFVALLM